MQSDSSLINKIKRRKFTEDEDQLLSSLVQQYGTKDWNVISQFMNGRNSRQCRDRWNHYLSPDISRKREWTTQEDEIIISQLKLVKHQWTYIASLLPGRTSVDVRNRSCKLSRMFDCDPFVKDLLKDVYKKKSYKFNDEDSGQSDSNSDTIQTKQKVVLPSCQELIKKFDTKIYFPIGQFINPPNLKV